MRSAVLPVVVVLAVVAGLVSGCVDQPRVTVTFAVDGMTCNSCSTAISQALGQVDGVETAGADHVAGTAEAMCRGRDVSDRDLVDAIEELGFTVKEVRRTAGERG